MSYDADQDHDITLQEAIDWTTNYRTSVGSEETRGHFFGKDAIEAIFDQANCTGMRIYYALDGNGAKQLVIVGVTSTGDDLYEGLLAERSLTCPANCASSSPLNSQ